MRAAGRHDRDVLFSYHLRDRVSTGSSCSAAKRLGCARGLSHFITPIASDLDEDVLLNAALELLEADDDQFDASHVALVDPSGLLEVHVVPQVPDEMGKL